jgi:uncharacterized protein (TIGR02145 family)
MLKIILNFLRTQNTLILIIVLAVLTGCKKIKEPLITTSEVSLITQTTASTGGNVTSDGGEAIQSRGVCWGIIKMPTLSGNKTVDSIGTGSFVSVLTGLTTGTTYNVRAYATNSSGTGYGNILSFTTSQIAIPVLTTTQISSISSTTAVSGGNVLSDNGGSVNARGVCWSISANPTIFNSQTTETGVSSIFASNITKLAASTVYYVRAYATNRAGTGYGNEVSFTTNQIAIPFLTTASITSITQTTAISGGNVTMDNGGSVIERGVCWSMSQDPSLSDSKSTDGIGTGVFSSSISGLSLGTTYFVRAYATNSAGTAYGNNVSFKTSPAVIQLAAVTAIDASAITNISAFSGGNITSDGGSEVLMRGVCWSLSQNPIITGNKTSDGTGTGVFTSSLTDLTSNRLYYARAYATNIAGTSYGNQVSFTTQPVLYGSVSDVDGNVYSTVIIGLQEWMTKNLKTVRYNDLTDIPLVADDIEWSNLTSPGYCLYNNVIATYGNLYNWFAVNTGKLCPVGWHVPSDVEWTELITNLGGESVAGGKLKETGLSHWGSPNTGATNARGFVALPGGFRSYSGVFSSITFEGNWWSSTSNPPTIAMPRGMSYNSISIYSPDFSKRSGFAVRCVRD